MTPTITNVLFRFVYTFAEGANAEQPRRKLEILPLLPVQKYPIGKQILLTCRPDVPEINLITDLQWKDNQGMTVQPKP